MATRVCILTSGHTVTDTRIFHREAKTLARSGYQVVLHGIQPNPDDPIPNASRQLLVRSFKPTRSRLNRFLISFPRALLFALRVRAQIYHLHDPELLPLALALKFFGRRVVCNIHKDYYLKLQDKSYLPRPLRPLLASLFHRWEKFIARHIDGVITATETVAHRLGPAPRRVVTIKNYPDLTPDLAVSMPFDRPERSKTTISSRAGKKFRIIHLARTLTPGRGITLLLDALCKLPNCELILAGRFVSPAYEREIKNHPGYQSVRYLGIIPHPDCFQWYVVSDVGVVPSLPHLGYEFALPVKMFEFMKAGLPVVVPDFPPLRAVIQESACGLTFVPGDVDSLVAALQNLKSQPEKARAMVDGESEDNTLTLLHQLIHQYPNHQIRILSNRHRTTPYALNFGLAQARVEVIFTFGAHNRYSPNYISEAVELLNQTDAAAVGSVAVTLPSAGTPIVRAIARVLASPFGVGNSLMRIVRRNRTIRSADTAAYPGYRRAVFTELGVFNTNLVRNHDLEFHLRLRRAGKKILLLPSIKTYYYARARLGDLLRNSFANGYWVVRGSRFAAKPFAFRHLVPLFFLLTACLAVFYPFGRPDFWFLRYLPFLFTAGSYLLLLLIFSALTTSSRRDLPCYLISYPILHFGYGTGSLWGILTYWRPDPAEKKLTLQKQKI